MLLDTSCMLHSVAGRWAACAHRFGEVVMEVDINDEVVRSALPLIIKANILHTQCPIFRGAEGAPNIVFANIHCSHCLLS